MGRLTQDRSRELFEKQLHLLRVDTDRVFMYLLYLQWAAVAGLAFVLTPYTWSGFQREWHPHLVAALIYGAIIAAPPLSLLHLQPGSHINRYVVAFAQMLMSSLLIHVTGGRIESHFQIFSALALLSFYRDWKVLALATVVTALDHFLGSVYYPYAIYGTSSAPIYRALEHAFWVICESSVLSYAIFNGRRALTSISNYQSQLEDTIEYIEEVVDERTRHLIASEQTIADQQLVLVHSSKMSALGEMAGGIAHEINNPVGIIQGKSQLLLKHITRGTFTAEMAKEQLSKIVDLTDRLSKIILGLRSLTRQADTDPMSSARLIDIVEHVLVLSTERFRNHGIELSVSPLPDVFLHCRAVQIEQVLLNLLNNAHDAIEEAPQKWVRLDFEITEISARIFITDSGSGIPEKIRDRLMQPFFTTKPSGKGTGLGLSISKRILEDHHGRLHYDDSCPNTRFIVEVPLAKTSSAAA